MKQCGRSCLGPTLLTALALLVLSFGAPKALGVTKDELIQDTRGEILSELTHKDPVAVAALVGAITDTFTNLPMTDIDPVLAGWIQHSICSLVTNRADQALINVTNEFDLLFLNQLSKRFAGLTNEKGLTLWRSSQKYMASAQEYRVQMQKFIFTNLAQMPTIQLAFSKEDGDLVAALSGVLHARGQGMQNGEADYQKSCLSATKGLKDHVLQLISTTVESSDSFSFGNIFVQAAINVDAVTSLTAAAGFLVDDDGSGDPNSATYLVEYGFG